MQNCVGMQQKLFLNPVSFLRTLFLISSSGLRRLFSE